MNVRGWKLKSVQIFLNGHFRVLDDNNDMKKTI